MNHLSRETSPYLLQHANNPVNWYPWSQEALDAARLANKPIFLSIGYAACHWCHVMERESFTDPVVAAFLNAHFVSIKVDREERPDLDDIYMQAVIAMAGNGGWPMSVFLTPDLKPFYGGTYYPPVRTHGMPSFLEVLHGIQQLWVTDLNKVEQFSEQMAHYLAKVHQQTGSAAVMGDLPAQLEALVADLPESYDWQNGGWGPAPKFPQHMLLQYLLAEAAEGNQTALKLATHNLDAMANGGIYDLVGGGFHRYSTDNRWLVPHFEKMLYDNALLIQNYLYGWLVSGNMWYKSVAVRSLDFVLREMQHPDGGFYSSLDADSEGHEGRFYTWSGDDFSHALSAVHAGVLPLLQAQPQFEGRLIPRLLSLPEDDQVPGLLDALDHLAALRAPRSRPATDDKVITSWNGLMLRTLAEAARYIPATQYLEAASTNADFLCTYLFDGRTVFRSWREGTARQPGFLEDYAGLVIGLLSLYQTDGNLRWFKTARQIFGLIPETFTADGFVYDAPASPDLLVRPVSTQDNATPSGSALYTLASLMMKALDDDDTYDRLLAPRLAENWEMIRRYPQSFGYWLQSAWLAAKPLDTLCLLTPEGAQPLAIDRSIVRPRLFIASGRPSEPGSPRILQDKPLRHGSPTAYLCHGATCLPSQTTNDALHAQLLGL